MNQLVLSGIDIGSSKIATLVAVKPNDTEEIKIIGFNSSSSQGVKKGLIVDIREVTEAVEESVEKAERMAGHKISEVFVSVGGPHISSLNSHGIVAITTPQGEITEEGVKRVIEAARAISLSSTRQIIEVAPRDFIVDGQSGIKNPVGMSGVRLEVDTHIITASSINLKNIERVLYDLDLKNLGFIFCGLASAEAVLTETEKELGVVLVDIGGGKTDIAIFVDGSLSYSSSIPIGARHITNDIAVGLRVSLDSAEKIKIHLSKNFISKKKLSQLDVSTLNLPEPIRDISLPTLVDGIISARIEEIYRLVVEEIKKSGFLDCVPAGLVITGGGALTLGMIEMGRKITNLPVRLGIPDKVSGLTEEINDPQFSTAVGLLLAGLENIIKEDTTQLRDFTSFLREFSLKSLGDKIKNFLKQFIP
ncbi:MAG: cell division protein FtsA [Patescibacteria group bacterium]|nr:cell division protein FtsA [Patescibacteria group bacterium]